ncbi:hypothetical protein Tco_0660914 [Tanacetum coccineum]
MCSFWEGCGGGPSIHKDWSSGMKVYRGGRCDGRGGRGGEDSFEDMFMTIVQEIFLGGFLMKEDALEALVILKMIMD